jgi:hypothetical protein
MSVDPADFLAKMLGVDIPQFLFNSELYFPLYELFVSLKEAVAVTCLSAVRAAGVRFPMW